MAQEPGGNSPATGEGTIHETPAAQKVFPPFDSTTFASQLFWFAITFLLFYWLMAKVVLPRIGGILEGRRSRIAGDLAEAEQAQARSDAAAAAYEKALNDARGRAHTIAEEARNSSRAAIDAQRAAIETDLAKKLTAAEARIAEVKARALADVGAIAADSAGTVVNVLSGLEASPKEVEEAVGAALIERGANG